jgi:hypothetical protein
VTLFDYPCNDVGHQVNNLCHTAGSKGHTTLNVGQVISRMIMDGDIMCCNRLPSAHEILVQDLNL